MSFINVRKSKWYSIFICYKCEERLSNEEVFYSMATCPHCGHKDDGTICDYKTVVVRSIKNLSL